MQGKTWLCTCGEQQIWNDYIRENIVVATIEVEKLIENRLRWFGHVQEGHKRHHLEE